MMKIPGYFFVSIVIFVFVYSCKSPKNQNRNFVNHSALTTVVITNENEINTAQVIDGYEFLKLGPTGDVLIGSIWDLTITDDYIIVVDKLNSKAIFIFNKQGESIAVIQRLGRGPQEYLDISHATLTADGKKIVVLDGRSDKVLYYDLTGEYIASKPVGFWFTTMEYMDDDHIVCAINGMGKDNPGLAELVNYNDLIFFTDGDFQIQGSAFANSYDYHNFSSITPNLAKFRDTLYINPSYSDTIYQVTGDGLQARYHLDMKEIHGVANFPSDITNEKMDQLDRENVTFSGSYIDTEKFALFQFTTPPKRMTTNYFYSKTKNKLYHLMNDFDREDSFFHVQLSGSCFSYKNQVVVAIPAYRLLTSIPEKSRKNNPVFEDLTDDSNPVLVFYNLNDPE